MTSSQGTVRTGATGASACAGAQQPASARTSSATIVSSTPSRRHRFRCGRPREWGRGTGIGLGRATSRTLGGRARSLRGGGRDGGVARGPELGGLVARRRRDGVRRARACLPPLPGGRRRGRRGADGDLARRRRARLPRRRSGRPGLAATSPPAARPARAGAGPRLARVPRGLCRVAASPRHRSSRGRRPSSGAASMFRTWRCSGWHWRAQRWWRGRRSMRACAASTRPPRPRWRATRRSRSRAPGPAACWSPRASPCSTTSARRSGATASPSSRTATAAATCSASAGPEYGTVHLWRGRWEEAEALLEASLQDFGRSRPANASPAR